MSLALKVGMDGEHLGTYRVRGGKIEIVAGSKERFGDLDRRLDDAMTAMVADHGVAPKDLTAEAVLRWMHAHRAQGRNWTELVESD